VKSSPAPPEYENTRLGATAWPETKLHRFHALAFAEGFALRKLISAYPGAQRTAYRLQTLPPGGGKMFVYRFGAVVFHNVPDEEQAEALKRLCSLHVGFPPDPVTNAFLTVVEDQASEPTMIAGNLRMDKVDGTRANLIATALAQSAAIAHYESKVDQMFRRLEGLVQRMAGRGTVAIGVRALHKFIGEALGTRSEALAVLHLLEKPPEASADSDLAPVYRQLSDSLDLSDRHQSMLQKVERVQEALELLLETARDARMVLLEFAVVVLIVFQIVVTMVT
jgi:required for meiotic nuclear division protein 1